MKEAPRKILLPYYNPLCCIPPGYRQNKNLDSKTVFSSKHRSTPHGLLWQSIHIFVLTSRPIALEWTGPFLRTPLVTPGWELHWLHHLVATYSQLYLLDILDLLDLRKHPFWLPLMLWTRILSGRLGGRPITCFCHIPALRQVLGSCVCGESPQGRNQRK